MKVGRLFVYQQKASKQQKRFDNKGSGRTKRDNCSSWYSFYFFRTLVSCYHMTQRSPTRLPTHSPLPYSFTQSLFTHLHTTDLCPSPFTAYVTFFCLLVLLLPFLLLPFLLLPPPLLPTPSFLPSLLPPPFSGSTQTIVARLSCPRARPGGRTRRARKEGEECWCPLRRDWSSRRGEGEREEGKKRERRAWCCSLLSSSSFLKRVA